MADTQIIFMSLHMDDIIIILFVEQKGSCTKLTAPREFGTYSSTLNIFKYAAS